MTMHVRTVLAAVSIAFVTASPAPVMAQSGSISLVTAAADHRLMRDPLGGASALVTVPFGQGGRSVRLQFERLFGDATRTGVPCSGLIEPGTCPPEPLADDARMATMAAGMGFPLMRRARFAAQVTTDVRLGRVSVDTRGLVSGDALAARKGLWGADIGLQGVWSPWARLPLALEAGVTVGRLMPLLREEVLDGYTPFNDGFNVSRLRLGLAWGRGAQR